MATLEEIEILFANYFGANNNPADRINLVQARLLPEGHWKGTKVPVDFTVYADANGNATATLPRNLESILAGTYQSSATACYGSPLEIRNSWYSYSMSGPGNVTGSYARQGIIPLEGRYTTFADWTTPKRLRIKLEQVEAQDRIIFKGALAGNRIYTQDGSDWIEGVVLDYSAGGGELDASLLTVTTDQLFDAPPYQIVKPITFGRISLFTVDIDGAETPVGVYDPDETTPSYKRYRVPACPTGSTIFSTICKKAYVPLVNKTDKLLIENLGAIRNGLKALQKEDAEDDIRADALWAKAKNLLIAESINDTGGAQGPITVSDDFEMQNCGGNQVGIYGGYTYGAWNE